MDSLKVPEGMTAGGRLFIPLRGFNFRRIFREEFGWAKLRVVGAHCPAHMKSQVPE